MIEQARTKRADQNSARRQRAWWAAALLLLAFVGSIGCNPITTMNFLIMPFTDNNDPPKCCLTLPGKESKIVIIAAHEDIQPSLMFKGADEFLMRHMSSLLEQRYKENGDKVKIVPVTKVLHYMQKHPEWVTQDRAEIGKQLDADFVVFLELGPMTLYERGAAGQLYRGSVEIDMHVFEVGKPEGETEKWQGNYSCQYPSRGAEDATSMREQMFRTKFLDHVAKDLVLYFAAHPPKDRIEAD